MNLTKAVGLVLVCSIIAAGASGCGLGTAVLGDQLDPGSVGLLVDNYGSADERGIANAELFNGGKVTYNPVTHTLYEYPVYFQTHSYAGENTITFSLSGSQASVDLGVTYRFKQEPIDASNPKYTYIHRFFRNYRVSPAEFNQTTMRNALRDCANEVVEGANPVEFATKPTKFQGPLTECLAKKFPELEIKEISFLSNPRLPENIQTSINKAFQARQDAETALSTAAKAKAEGEAAVVKAKADQEARIINAETEVQVNERLSRSVTPQLLELRRLEIQQKLAEQGINPNATTTIQTPNVQVSGAQVQQPKDQ